MSALRFDIATPGDDAQLREVLASTPMGGRIQVSFRREPSFFQAGVVEGPFLQALVARNGVQVAAIGCRSVRDRFVNGHPLPIGYLSGLRLRPEYRSTGLLGRGYRFLHKLHQDGRTRLYLTTIAEGNEVARQMLTSGRTWLPQYHGAGTYHTLVIRPRRARMNTRPDLSVLIRRASHVDLPQILQFFQQAGPGRQFFPCYTADDFGNPEGTFRGLPWENLFLAERNEQLVGMLGVWDQRGFRQTVVEGYQGWMRATRHLYNAWAAVSHLPCLPAPHTVFPFVTAALPVVQPNEEGAEVFRQLLVRVCNELAGGLVGPSDLNLLLGLHADDPLLAVARPLAANVYNTLLYYVCWPDGESLLGQLDDRPPYLELGCL